MTAGNDGRTVCAVDTALVNSRRADPASPAINAARKHNGLTRPAQAWPYCRARAAPGSLNRRPGVVSSARIPPPSPEQERERQ